MGVLSLVLLISEYKSTHIPCLAANLHAATQHRDCPLVSRLIGWVYVIIMLLDLTPCMSDLWCICGRKMQSCLHQQYACGGKDSQLFASNTSSPRRSIRVWKDSKCIETLQGHEGPVQCLLLLPNGDFLSGSNDTTIKLWSNSKCVHTFPGHTDTVRQVISQL